MRIMMICALLLTQTYAAPPKALTAETFDQVKAYASPGASDMAFQSLDWHSHILDGLVEGNKQDKPVVMNLYFGDPRGHC